MGNLPCHERLRPGMELPGGLRLKEFLGRGSFGAVFRAEQIVRGTATHDVAIKIVFPASSQDSRQRQLRELQALAQLEHPNIVRAFLPWEVDIGDPNGMAIYLPMEMADLEPSHNTAQPQRAITLRTVLDEMERRNAPADDRIALAREVGLAVASALAYLAAPGLRLTHKDIKPENILRVGGRWKLADFGLATPIVQGDHHVTRIPVGTLAYMPPEAYEAHDRSVVSPSWDIWSLGVVLFEIFAGGPFRPGQAPIQEAATLPRQLRRIVRGCLAADWSVRWSAVDVQRHFMRRPGWRGQLGLSFVRIFNPNAAPERKQQSHLSLMGALKEIMRRSLGPMAWSTLMLLILNIISTHIQYTIFFGYLPVAFLICALLWNTFNVSNEIRVASDEAPSLLRRFIWIWLDANEFYMSCLFCTVILFPYWALWLHLVLRGPGDWIGYITCTPIALMLSAVIAKSATSIRDALRDDFYIADDY